MFCGETSYPKRGTDCLLSVPETVRQELNFYMLYEAVKKWKVVIMALFVDVLPRLCYILSIQERKGKLSYYIVKATIK
jgi:hypothetical protein